MRKPELVGVLLSLAITPLGCNSKAASNSNFKSAIQASYDKKPRCELWGDRLPFDLDPKAHGYRRDSANYEALKSAGLVVSQSSMKVIADPFALDPDGSVSHTAPPPRPIVTYSVGGANKSAWTAKGELCYGRVHVTTIDGFTEPSETMGLKRSLVSYSYRITDVPAWARDATIQEALPRIKMDLFVPRIEETMMMVLTKNGWRTSDDIR